MRELSTPQNTGVVSLKALFTEISFGHIPRHNHQLEKTRGWITSRPFSMWVQRRCRGKWGSKIHPEWFSSTCVVISSFVLGDSQRSSLSLLTCKQGHPNVSSHPLFFSSFLQLIQLIQLIFVDWLLLVDQPHYCIQCHTVSACSDRRTNPTPAVRIQNTGQPTSPDTSAYRAPHFHVILVKGSTLYGSPPCPTNKRYSCDPQQQTMRLELLQQILLTQKGPFSVSLFTFPGYISRPMDWVLRSKSLGFLSEWVGHWAADWSNTNSTLHNTGIMGLKGRELDGGL